MLRSQKFLQHIFRNSSSLKVFYYVVEPRRHPIERIFWLACYSCASLGAVWLSLSTWYRYQESPTVISLERHSLDWNTTLPAFSLCPKQRVNTSVVRELARSVYPDNIEQGIKFLNALANWTYPNLGHVPFDGRFEPSRYQQLLMDIKLNFSHSLPEGTMVNNVTSLSLSMTELGICYTLNSQIPYYLNPKYWQSGSWRLRKPIPLIHGNPLDVAELSAQVNDIKVKMNAFLHEVEETVDGSANYMYSVDHQEALVVNFFKSLRPLYKKTTFSINGF